MTQSSLQVSCIEPLSTKVGHCQIGQGLSCICHTNKDLQTTEGRGKWRRWEPWHTTIQWKRKTRRTKFKTRRTFRHHLSDILRTPIEYRLITSERCWRKVCPVLVLLIFLFCWIFARHGSQRLHFPRLFVVWRFLMAWEMQESPCL